jgi:hypothetical protein
MNEFYTPFLPIPSILFRAADEIKHIILPEIIRVCPVSSTPGECALSTKLADAATEPVQSLCDAKTAAAP